MDAVRFSVTDDTPSRLLVVYVVEKNHAPVEFGTLEYSIAAARLEEPCNVVGPVISDVLALQARAFLASYLGRKGDRSRVRDARRSQ